MAISEKTAKAIELLQEVQPAKLVVTYAWYNDVGIEATLNADDVERLVEIVRKRVIQDIKNNLK